MRILFRRIILFLILFGLFLVFLGILASVNLFLSHQPEIMNENESFKSLYLEDDVYRTNLLSNFGEEEYDCTGSCYCVYDRRTSIPLISRSISYVVVSISSVIAFHQAQEYFETKCQEQLSQECDESFYVKSSVDSCSPINEQTSETKDTYFEDRENEERRVFYCFGNCVPNLQATKRGTNRKESSRIYSKEIDCGALKNEGEIILYESDLIVKSLEYPITQRFRLSALDKFQKDYLTDICRENSKVDYVYEGTRTDHKTGKIYPNLQKKTGFACVARSRYRGGKRSEHKNVRCRQMVPESRSTSRKYWIRKFNERKQEWDEGKAL